MTNKEAANIICEAFSAANRILSFLNWHSRVQITSLFDALVIARNETAKNTVGDAVAWARQVRKETKWE